MEIMGMNFIRADPVVRLGFRVLGFDTYPDQLQPDPQPYCVVVYKYNRVHKHFCTLCKLMLWI